MSATAYRFWFSFEQPTSNKRIAGKQTWSTIHPSVRAGRSDNTGVNCFLRFTFFEIDFELIIRGDMLRADTMLRFVITCEGLIFYQEKVVSELDELGILSDHTCDVVSFN